MVFFVVHTGNPLAHHLGKNESLTSLQIFLQICLSFFFIIRMTEVPAISFLISLTVGAFPVFAIFSAHSRYTFEETSILCSRLSISNTRHRFCHLHCNLPEMTLEILVTNADFPCSLSCSNVSLGLAA